VTTTGNTTVTAEIRIAARPDTVFEFFVDPEKLMRWKGVEATLEPRPGGLYRCNVNGRDIAVGRYVAIERPHRIVFTWGWEGEGHPVPPGSSTVEVTLEPDGAGTLVRLEHRDLPAPAAEQHREGWLHYLDRLAIAGAGGDAGPDPWVERGMGDAAS
jgi:uncharacterized protein YndB with AHSA1/START domain